MQTKSTYTRKEVEDLLQEHLDLHRQIVVGLQADIKDADTRAGQAWRLLRRYKSRVRQLVSQRDRMLGLVCPDHCPAMHKVSYRNGYNRALSDLYAVTGDDQK